MKVNERVASHYTILNIGNIYKFILIRRLLLGYKYSERIYITDLIIQKEKFNIGNTFLKLKFNSIYKITCFKYGCSIYTTKQDL